MSREKRIEDALRGILEIGKRDSVTFGIGAYHGEWTGKEEQMEEQHTILCQSSSKKYAELLYKEIIAGRGSPHKVGLPRAKEQAGNE